MSTSARYSELRLRQPGKLWRTTSISWGVSSLAAGHLTLIPQLRQELADLGREDLMIVAGGVIPPEDVETLYKAGAAAVFGPGTVIGEAAIKLIQELAKRLGFSLEEAGKAGEG